MAESSRRDFLKKGATAALGVGALGTLSGGLAAGCAVEMTGTAMSEAVTGLTFKLNEPKLKQLRTFPEVLREFVEALDEVTAGLLSDPSAYATFIENSDAVGSLKVWDVNAQMLSQLVGPTDGETKRGRLRRILTVSELYDAAAPAIGPGFLDSERLSSSSSSSGSCATNGSATNGCCVIHTWGWSAGQGLCSGFATEQSPEHL